MLVYGAKSRLTTVHARHPQRVPSIVCTMQRCQLTEKQRKAVQLQRGLTQCGHPLAEASCFSFKLH
eukprot:361250-Chlamydomonas_euryale.AAC.17